MERVRKRQIIFLICTAFLVIFYVTPVYRSVGTGTPTPFAHLQGYNLSLVTSSASLLPNFCQNLECLPNLWGSESKVKYLVYTSTCKIVDMDPFDASVTKFLNKNFKPVKCRNKPLVKLDKQTLRIDKNQIKNWKFVNSSCCYREVNRVTQSSTKYNKNADWTVSISTKCTPISSEGTRVDIPFLKVECQNGINVKTSTDFLAVLLPPSKHSKETKRKAEQWDKRRTEGIESPPSVLIIGVDSISRLHMKRQLPETLKYLETHDFVEMKGYTKIGENTFPNIMGAVGGMIPYHFPCMSNQMTTKVDDCPLIWKNFSQNGYLTALLEDAPGIAIFNYEKTGFVTAPTDYYLRPLMTASHIEAKRPKSSAQTSCFEGLSPTDYMSNYIKRFLSVNGSQYPYFLLSWFTSIGHDDFNGLQNGDHAFLDLLKEAIERPESGSNNTIILFISDHGYRFGDFRETFLGFYEDNLPFFFIKVPKALQERFPHWYQNLQDNSHLLTTPFDLHETLKDILELSNYNFSTSQHANMKGSITPDTTYPTRDPHFRDRYSFFEQVPTNRTCESSHIPQSYCMCGVSPENGRTSEKSTHLAHFVLEELNNRILFDEGIKTGLCAKLNFSKVLYGRESGRGDIWNNFGALVEYQDFVVALEATPGLGHFEARVRVFENGTEVLTDSVNRINSYRGQSDCMRNYKLKNFCMCQDVLDKENAKKKKKNKKG